jgi:hypothetical protein
MEGYLMSEATVETVKSTLELELVGVRQTVDALRISLAELKKSIRGLLEDNLDEESEEITISLEDANEYLVSQGLKELEIEREYNVRGKVTFSFDMTVTATSEDDAKSQAENASIRLECYDADALDYEELVLTVYEVEVAE